MYAFGTHSFNGMKNKIAMYLLLALLAAGLVFCGSAAAANLVPAASSRVKTMGRWIPDENGSLYAGRGAVIASVEFEGTGVQVQMFSDSLGDVWWLKKLDDGPLRGRRRGPGRERPGVRKRDAEKTEVKRKHRSPAPFRSRRPMLF